MKLYTKILLFFLIGLLLSSCNLYRKIPEGKYLLRNNVVVVDGKKESSEKVNSQIVLQPNAFIFGYPYLADLYMLADQHPDATYYHWIQAHPKNYRFLKKLLSRKQIIQLQYYYRDINKTIQKVGKAPVFIDTSKIKLSSELLKHDFINHSYLDAESGFEIDTLGKHKAKVIYRIHKKHSYFINKYEQNIQSPYLLKLYKHYSRKSPIKEHKPYLRENFVKEKENLVTLFRNNGVFHFQPSYINFDLVYDSVPKRQIDAYLNVPDRTITNQDTVYSEPFVPYRIKNVNIYLSKNKNFSFFQKKDSAVYEGINIFTTNDKLRYTPKLLAGSVFIKPGRWFSDRDRLRTHRLLMSLQNFKQAYIQYEENKRDTTLNANIYLIPEKRFSWKGSTDFMHSNIHDFGIKGSMSFSAKNLFRGAEILNTSLYFMTATSKSINSQEDQFFAVSELGADVTLKFPRLLLPFGLNKYIPKYMLPKTYITFLSNSQTNIGLDRSKYAGIFGFEWRPIKERKIKIDLLNYMFITNKKAYKYFDIYTLAFKQVQDIAQQLGQTLNNPEAADAYVNSLLHDNNFASAHPDLYKDLRNIKEREKRITQNIFILSNKFDFFYDSRKHPLQPDFYLFNSTFELAGGMLGLAKKSLNRNEYGQYIVNNIPYAEYFKTDLSFIKHWELHKEHIIAYRAFVGYAAPYGNSKSVPFVSSYFAGGSNDIRGWRAYSLGPGSTGGPNEFNEANFKLTTNLEYRFPIAGYFKGAVFADAGNIWNVDNDETNPKSRFSGFESLKDIAIASGFGLRVDFTYFIIRFDLAFKVYDPAKDEVNRWIDIKDTKLTDGVLNLGISYPF